MNVVKRDGRVSVFNKQKIIDAILKAFEDVDHEITDAAYAKAEEIASSIEQSSKDCAVEDIQDVIERRLMASNRKDVARAFIIYRNDRTRVRESKSELMKAVGEKLNASNVQNQNANVDEYSFGGRMGEARDTVAKEYALYNCMSKMSRDNHLNNEVYIHDLNSYAVGMHNCLSVPFDDLLAKGFKVRQTDIRPARSINTAFQLVAVIFQLQSLNQFGGVSATHLDWTMVPYVRISFYKHFKDGLIYIAQWPESAGEGFRLQCEEEQPSIGDKEYFVKVGMHSSVYQYALDMTEKETYQAVEAMYHNLNSLQSRSGDQLPFTSINYGTCTLPEGRLVTKAILDVSIKGIGALHRTPIFPCGIFQYMKGVNDKPGTPNYDLYRLALKSTALRLYPNYANVDWSGNAGYDRNDPKTYFSTMGERKLWPM